MDQANTTPTIPNLDDALSGIYRRVSDIEQNLHDGLFGESPREQDGDKTAMSSPSLASLNQRINEIRDTISTIETHVAKIHASNKIAG